MNHDPVVFFGCSAGGLHALQTIFMNIPDVLSFPIVVAQHLPLNIDIDLQTVFGSTFKGKIFEAGDKTPLKPGAAYFAPPGYHLLVERDRTCSLSQDQPVNFFRPSIDVLFVSAGTALGPSAVGILLTGANQDGAEGLLHIQAQGGMTIVQDPDEAQVPVMPLAALEVMRPDAVLDLKSIAAKLAEISRTLRSA